MKALDASPPISLSSSAFASSAALPRLRPVDHRSRQAQAALDAGKALTALQADPITVELFRYFRGLRIAQSDAERQRRTQGMPAMAAAVELREPLHAGLAPVVEARVLARQRPQEIAAATGLEAEVVHWYEAAYFDVRDRLGMPAFILEQAVGHSPGNQWPSTLRLFGYLGGVVVLEELLPEGRGTSTWRTPVELVRQLGFSARAMLASQLRTAASMLDLSRPQSAGPLVKLIDVLAEGLPEIEGPRSPDESSVHQLLGKYPSASPRAVFDPGWSPSLGRVPTEPDRAATKHE